MTKTDDKPQQVPGPIGAAEDWLVKECCRVLQSHFPSIESGPGEWSESYLRRVLKAIPAVRVAWEGGQARESGELTVDTVWTIYVITGWQGRTEQQRRRGDAKAIGAYRACELLAPILHNSVIPAPDGCGGDRIRVADIRNFWTGEIDKVGVALYGIGLKIPLALDPDDEILEENYDEFLRAGIDWDLPGADDETDAEELLEVRAGGTT